MPVNTHWIGRDRRLESEEGTLLDSSTANRDIAVVGLDYIGLRLATVLAEMDTTVIGVEKRSDVVDLLTAGIPHFSECGLAEALSRVTKSGRLVAAQQFHGNSQCETYIIAVGTPLTSDGVAREDMIQTATREVAANMRDGVSGELFGYIAAHRAARGDRETETASR
jgi:UDP-N-acetyl-D-mannosaminuronic acid dehydrogenase